MQDEQNIKETNFDSDKLSKLQDKIDSVLSKKTDRVQDLSDDIEVTKIYDKIKKLDEKRANSNAKREEPKKKTTSSFSKYLDIAGQDSSADNKQVIKDLLNEIESSDSKTDVIIDDNKNRVAQTSNQNSINMNKKFPEHAISALMKLYDKMIMTKDNEYNTLKRENLFLKKTVLEMQKYINSDRKVIDATVRQLEKSQEEMLELKDQYRALKKEIDK